MQFDERTYGERIAGVYDEFYAAYDEAQIDLLHELAGDGPALELGIGTGRIALPLRGRGVEVAGIDASPEMIARLRAKPGGDEIEVIEGSFARFELGRRFRLVFVVFNTLFALMTHEDQVSCFQSVADHLADGGRFLVEAFVPDLARFVAHQALRAIQVTEEQVQLDASRHDPVTQQITSQHVLLTEEGVRLYPVKIRYAFPSELDLMARLAGLARLHRWSSWDKQEFTAGSGMHISVSG